ncbi:MAG: hypothetical protein M1503_07550 [Thaumarchaeota archaeon]|nr:hypothetical protein [Nitrososphaerota archaeon]MCL5318097.1 hypothetical protein [Nitrososphaerota archaeon]
MFRRALLTLMLAVVLSDPLFLTQVYAEEGPSVSYANAGYDSSLHTGFNVTTPTEDGGNVQVIFAWQIAAPTRGWRDSSFLRVYDTYPTLQMLKNTKDGTLNYSVTYIPLYLIQYEDANGNGIFDVQTRKSSMNEFSDQNVNWNSSDEIVRIYSLAPMYTYFQQKEPSGSWSWDVSNLTKVNKGDAPEYDWNLSASVKSYDWQLMDERYRIEQNNVSVHFSYKLTIKHEGPTIKLGYGINGVTWAQGQDVKLAVISAVIYQGKDEVVVKTEGQYEGLPGASFIDQSIALVENATKSTRSMITYSPIAVVDGVTRTDAVKSALQPVFVVSTPVAVPQGVNVQGLNPGFGDQISWRYSVAFANQLSFSRFNNSVYQDPEISLAAPLLLTLPVTLVNPQWFIVIAVTIFIAYAVVRVALRRWIREPFTTGNNSTAGKLAQIKAQVARTVKRNTLTAIYKAASEKVRIGLAD